jgi:4-amino-4-deoxy-L-arabinose transferase
MTQRSLWIQVGLLFAVLYLALLGARPMITPDEPRYGAMAQEMLARGDWLSLRMVGFAYYEKPPLGTWLMAASMACLGHNAFAIRLPGALAALASALAAGMMARRIAARTEAAPLAAMVQLTTVMPMVLATVAILDPVFTAFVSLTLALFLEGSERQGRARAAWLLLSGVAAGAAFLTKGLLAFAIPAVAAASFLLWERRWRDMVVMPWLPMLGAAAVAGPVAWMLHRANPGFWEYFVLVEHLRRFANPDGNQHSEPWWLLGVVTVVGGLFWMLLWPRGCRPAPSADPQRRAWRFAICCVVPPLLLLSLSKGKLPTYVLPLFPAISALVAAGLLRWREGRNVSRDGGTWVAECVTMALAAAAMVLSATGLHRWGLPTLWHSGERVHLLLAGLALLAWSLLETRAHRASSAVPWLVRTAWVPVPALMLVHLLLPTAALSAPKAPWAMLERHAEALRRSDRVASINSMAHAVSWAAHRHDLAIFEPRSEFDNELGLEHEQPRFVRRADFLPVLDAWMAQGSVTLVLDTDFSAVVVARLGDRIAARSSDRDVTILEIPGPVAP